MVILDAVLGAAKDLFREWKRSSGKRTSSAAAAAAVTGAASTAAASAASARGAVPAFRVPPANAEVYETRPPKKHRRSKKHSPHDKKKANGRKADKA